MRQTPRLSPLIAAAFATCLSLPALAQTTTQTVPVDDIVFVPPVIGAPGDRIGAGTRGGGETGDGERGDGVRLLAPPGGGLSATQSPRLYWWLDTPFDGTLQIDLTADGADRPLLSFDEDAKLAPGLQVFALPDLGLRIRDAQIYRWTVRLTPQDARTTLSASSFVEFRASDDDAAGTAGADGKGAIAALAANGYWYDAFDQAADGATLTDVQKKLMAQAGFPEAE